MKYASLLIVTFLVFALSSCEKRPEACLDFGDYLEAGDNLIIESCSKNYEFLTWEFNDNRGYIGDLFERQFELEGNYQVKLTAYSDGGYRSDELTHEFRASYRYIDRFEIIGESDYSAFIVDFKNDRWSLGIATGIFLEDAPFVINVLPNDTARIAPTSVNLDFYGRRAFSNVPLGKSNLNYHIFKDNPVVVTSEDGKLELRMYWKFLD